MLSAAIRPNVLSHYAIKTSFFLGVVMLSVVLLFVVLVVPQKFDVLNIFRLRHVTNLTLSQT
jgi:hypothetical protein